MSNWLEEEKINANNLIKSPAILIKAILVRTISKAVSRGRVFLDNVIM